MEDSREGMEDSGGLSVVTETSFWELFSPVVWGTSSGTSLETLCSGLVPSVAFFIRSSACVLFWSLPRLSGAGTSFTLSEEVLLVTLVIASSEVTTALLASFLRSSDSTWIPYKLDER